MVKSCSVFGCHNRKDKDSSVSFHRIPSVVKRQGSKIEALTSKRRRLWLASIGRKSWLPSENARVCSVHFVSGKTSKDCRCPVATSQLYKPFFSYDFRGVKTVQAKTTWKEKLRYTVVLAAMADGTKLPSMIVFKGLKMCQRDGFRTTSLFK